MQPGRVVRRYQFALVSGALQYRDAMLAVEGEAEEMCEPDEWGEPGRVVSRRWLWIRDRHGNDAMHWLERRRITGLHSPHAATWADFDVDY